MFEDMFKLVKTGEVDATVAAVKAELEKGTSPQAILNDGLIAALTELGVEFQAGDVYIPELLMASEAMKAGVEILRPLLMQGDIKKIGKCLLLTVEGDVHDIGKNLVLLFLESAGFDVVDMGADVDVDDVIETIEEDEDIQIVGMSAMLTTTMYAMQDVIDELEDAGLRDRVKVMIGGAPVTKEFADKIGADGYSLDAPQAVELAKQLIAEL